MVEIRRSMSDSVNFEGILYLHVPFHSFKVLNVSNMSKRQPGYNVRASYHFSN